MCLVHVFIFVRKAEHMYEMRAQRGEERWDESTERRGDKIKKKADQWIRAQSKKFIIEFNFITHLPSEISIYCLKSPSVTFQNILFKHGFFNNNFQTTLFWILWPNIFFSLLDTSVQCFKHWTLCFELTDQMGSKWHQTYYICLRVWPIFTLFFFFHLSKFHSFHFKLNPWN